MFKTEQEAINWVWMHIPIGIKSVSKKARTMYTNVFASNRARIAVCETIGKKIYEELDSKPYQLAEAVVELLDVKANEGCKERTWDGFENGNGEPVDIESLITKAKEILHDNRINF